MILDSFRAFRTDKECIDYIGLTIQMINDTPETIKLTKSARPSSTFRVSTTLRDSIVGHKSAASSVTDQEIRNQAKIVDD